MKADLDRIAEYIDANARPLDRARFRHQLLGEPLQPVLDELATFQNDDGGYGHALESDLRLPDSSPICTWVALHLLIELGVAGDSPLVQRALAYLVDTYEPRRHGWAPVSAAVNDYPHGAWWDYDESKGGTAIHQTPMNPTAALVGFMWHYGTPGPPSRGRLTERAIEYLQGAQDRDIEMHEMKVLVQLAELSPEPQAEPLRRLTAAAADRIVETDPEEWEGYGPQPLTFVSGPDHYLMPTFGDHVEPNLNDWLETLREDGNWNLPYQWHRDEEVFEQLKPQLTASFAVHRAVVLRAFGRI